MILIFGVTEQLVSLYVQPHILLILLLRDVVPHITLFRSLYSSGKAVYLDCSVYLCWFLCFFDVCVLQDSCVCVILSYQCSQQLLSDVVHHIHLTETHSFVLFVYLFIKYTHIHVCLFV